MHTCINDSLLHFSSLWGSYYYILLQFDDKMSNIRVKSHLRAVFELRTAKYQSWNNAGMHCICCSTGRQYIRCAPDPGYSRAGTDYAKVIVRYLEGRIHEIWMYL
jgi:hypothetical protein